jgi:hypothetical protein
MLRQAAHALRHEAVLSDRLNEIGVFVRIAASIAIAGACVCGGGHDGRADIGVGGHGRANLINFINC